jgi:predicted acetyltransferase
MLGAKSRSSRVEVRQLEDEEEALDFARILAWAFSVKLEDTPRWIEHTQPENVRVALTQGKVAGGLFLIPMGQWFGGRSVAMTGVAAVAVAAEWRGQGVGKALMEQVVTELSSSGVALSTLYPAALTLYRAVGYESAGSRFEVRLRPEDIRLSARELPVTPIEPGDLSEVEQVYRRYASFHPGYVDRGRNLWSRVRQCAEQTARGFAVRYQGNIEGYLYAVEQRPDERGRYAMALTDLVALTPRAGLQLLCLLADHRSLVPELRWHGGPCGELLSLLPEPRYRVSLVDHFATRVLDVELALSSRGYPPLDAELSLEVVDPLLKRNNGRFLLEVASGQGHVRRGGAGGVRVHIRGLAPLFSGFLSPHALQSAGLLQAQEPALSLAAALFSGPAPCMPDGF